MEPLCGSFEEERARLEPIFRAAEAAHRNYRSAWKRALDGGEWETFKDTEERRNLLNAFHGSQEPLEEAGERILLYLPESPGIVPAALAYLSIRSRPFRSGYVCQRILRRLFKVELSPPDQDRLRAIVLDRLSWPWVQSRDLFRWFTRLRTPALGSALEQLSEDERAWVRERARKALTLLASRR